MGAPATYALKSLQMLMVDTLTADPMFNGSQSANGQPVPILTERIGDLVTQIGISIGKLGLCLVVRTPLFKFTNNLAPSLDGWALLSVDVFEDVTINQGSTGTQIDAESAAERLLALMHHYPLTGSVPSENNPSKFIGTDSPLTLANEGPPLQYSVLFQAHLTLATPQP
jgi:hypothetical protein